MTKWSEEIRAAISWFIQRGGEMIVTCCCAFFGGNDYNLVLYLTAKHVFEWFGVENCLVVLLWLREWKK